jgi:hypothetical protein
VEEAQRMDHENEKSDSHLDKTLWKQIQSDSDSSNRVRDALNADLAPYTARLAEGVERLNKLLSTAQHLNDPLSLVGSLTREAEGDILRAVVVLMHAYLEDFLRTVARALLPIGDERVLVGIPLAGVTSRAEKFNLGQLVQHKGKSVDDVLRQSISEYLDRSNFSSTGEIGGFLSKLGFDVEKHNQEFALIDQMIQRRHDIVHRADRIRPGDKKMTSYNRSYGSMFACGWTLRSLSCPNCLDRCSSS